MPLPSRSVLPVGGLRTEAIGSRSIMSGKFLHKRTLLVCAGFICIVAVAWVGFKKVQQMMLLGHIDSAIGRVRSISDAERAFAHAYPATGYTCALSELSHEGQIVRLLKDGSDNGYTFAILGCDTRSKSQPNLKYQVKASPLQAGLPAFCSDQSGVLKSDESGSSEKCLAAGIPVGGS